MTASTLPVSNVINVTIAPTPAGLTERNVNSLAIFTNEVPDNLDAYGIYNSAAQVADDYGTSSVTAQMATAVFSQVPNVLSGQGRLVVIPFTGVSATGGTMTTADISANLATLIAVTNGDIKVTIDSVANNLHGLNFTGCSTLAEIASVIQGYLPSAIVSASSTTITIASKKVGTASTVVIATYSGGGTDLYGNTYLKGATQVDVAGTNSSGEALLAAVARTSNVVGYVPFMTNINLDDTAIETVATGVQALDNMFLHHCSSPQDIAGVCTTIQQATETKTRMLLYTVSQATANLMKAAYAGRGFSTDYNGSNTVSTMNLKSLATITPDPGITQTMYSNAKTAGVDIYVSYAGVPSVLSTGGNDYFDNVYADLALKFSLETAGFNYLRQTNTKVPQTEPGMNGLKAAYANILQQYIRNGSIAPGSWTSSETFGNPQLFVTNILTTGYYIYSLPIALQNSTQREQRIAPLVQIAVKRAGAIQSGNVIVAVND